MKKSTITSNLSPEKERLAIRDISIATESLTKEGDLFYLLTHRSILHTNAHALISLSVYTSENVSVYLNFEFDMVLCLA